MSSINTQLKKLQRGGYTSLAKSKYFNFKSILTKEMVSPSLHRFDYNNLVIDIKKNIERSIEYKNTNDWEQKEFKVPHHYIHDIKSMYLNPANILEYQNPSTESKKTKFKILQNMYNSLYKSFTEDNDLYSDVITSEITAYLQWHVFNKFTKEERDQLEKNQGDNDDSSGGNKTESVKNSNLDKKLEGIVKNTNKELSEALDRASETIQEMKELGIGSDNSLGTSSNINKSMIKKIVERLRKEDNNRLKKLFKVILDNSKNYFTSKVIYDDESIFDSDIIEDIENIEYLHPAFKKAHLMDITCRTPRSVGKVDIYIDCSGSMGKLLIEAKIIALKLIKMNYAHDVYYFNNYVHKPKQDFNSILIFNKGGGTNFNKVLLSIKNSKRNSVVITDGQSGCQEYDEKTFFIGVGGANFRYFNRNDISSKFLKNKQCIKVDNSGKFSYTKYEKYD